MQATTTSNLLQDTHDAAAVARAIEENFFAFWRVFARWMGTDIHENAGMLWTTSDLALSLVNTVARTELADREADAAIDRVLADYAARRVPVQWMIGPTTHPADLATRLRARGFVPDGSEPGMAVELALLGENAAIPAKLEIRPVVDRAGLLDWSRVSIEVFIAPEMPSLAGRMLDYFARHEPEPPTLIRSYLGYWDGEPVATTSLMPAAGVAGIYNVATVPRARNRGIAGAMTMFALREGQALGYRVGILQSSDMGYKVYRRLGMVPICRLFFLARRD